MKYFKFSLWLLVLSCLLTIVVAEVAVTTESNQKKADVCLLWASDTESEYDQIAWSPDLAMCIGVKTDRDGNSIKVAFDPLSDKRLDLPVIHGEIERERLNDEYARLKATGKLAEFSGIVNHGLFHSKNLKYMGVLQTRFCRENLIYQTRLSLFTLNLGCTKKQELWSVYLSECADEGSSNNMLRGVEPKSVPEKCIISDNGNVMVYSGDFRTGTAKHIEIYDIAGNKLAEAGNGEDALPPLGFSMAQTGEFYFHLWSKTKLGAECRYFRSDGNVIGKDDYYRRFEDKDITQQPFWTKSRMNGILAYRFFSSEEKNYVAYVMAKNGRGCCLSLYDLDKGVTVWERENKDTTREIVVVGASQDGSYLIVAKRLFWDRSKLSDESFERKLNRSPISLSLVDTRGNVIGRGELHPADSITVSQDGTRILTESPTGAMKLYSVKPQDQVM